MSKERIKKLIPLAAIVVVLILVLNMCSGGGNVKSVAVDFAEALLDDADGKKVVSLMSEDLLESTLRNTECATKKVLIEYLNDGLEETRSDYKKVTIKYIDKKELSDGTVEVYLSCTYTQDQLLSFKDKETTDTLTLTLTKEGSKWKVCDF